MRIVLINGAPRVGKDTTAKIVDTFYARTHLLKFSDPLKNGVHAALNLGVSSAHFENTKDTPLLRMFGYTPRELYIWFSEEVMKKKFGPAIIGKLIEQQICDLDVNCPARMENVFILSDCGFIEEVRMLVDAFGASRFSLLRIHREGYNFKNDSRSLIYSERVRSWDIYNNGTPDDLRKQLIEWRDGKLPQAVK